MNLIDAKIVEVISEPFEKYNKWWVEVKIDDSYGSGSEPSDYQVMKETLEEALLVKVGDIVQV
jgi:predicted nucleotide-binding protein (sugar kinase/HSP70/actin superfamily)